METEHERKGENFEMEGGILESEEGFRKQVGGCSVEMEGGSTLTINEFFYFFVVLGLPFRGRWSLLAVVNVGFFLFLISLLDTRTMFVKEFILNLGLSRFNF